MSANFVPGPWALAWEDGKHGVVGSTTEGKLICIVGNATPDDGREPVRKANAQLIAAAPELLAACELACSVIDNSEVYMVISKAIAKARGESA